MPMYVCGLSLRHSSRLGRLSLLNHKCYMRSIVCNATHGSFKNVCLIFFHSFVKFIDPLHEARLLRGGCNRLDSNPADDGRRMMTAAIAYSQPLLSGSTERHLDF